MSRAGHRSPSRSQGHAGGRGKKHTRGGSHAPARPVVDKARWVIGLHSCEETLMVRPKAVRELWLRDGWESSTQLRELEEKARAHRITIRGKSVGQLDHLGSGHQGVALACLETPQVNWERLGKSEGALVVILDGIEDPHNLGSILRTAWLAGAQAIFTPVDHAVGLTPTACKVASGGAEHVPVEAVTNLASLMEELKKQDFWIYGLAEGGTKLPWDFALAKKTAWVVGAEGGGIRKPVERACDELVRLPQVSSGSSYNAAVACAMALGETCRQFGHPK
jgi:23S rRNA (guanosine2251-2'-O)-methyltransferase